MVDGNIDFANGSFAADRLEPGCKVWVSEGGKT